MCGDIKKVIELLTVPVKVGIVKIIQYYCILCHLRDPKPFTFHLSFQARCCHVSIRVTERMSTERNQFMKKGLLKITVWGMVLRVLYWNIP